MPNPKKFLYSKIWQEEPEDDNPFTAKRCICSGYDVYGDLLGKISWVEYLYLLFTLERPTREQSRLLEGVAVILANPGIRDHSVRAAMLGGVGRSHSAASLIAALSVGAGQLGGAREVCLAMQYWHRCGLSLENWVDIINNPHTPEQVDVWPEMEHVPGFDPHGTSCSTIVKQSLTYLRELSPNDRVNWLCSNQGFLEETTRIPLALTGVIAAALSDLNFSPEQGEMLYLLLRLPGAGAHALEQKKYGWRKYPFFNDSVTLTNDPGPRS